MTTKSLSSLIISSIGIVYGDIGTSPLYTLRECLSIKSVFIIEQDTVFGFLSLIFWMLIIIVSCKYLMFVMKADNVGEGGILTLMSLSINKCKKNKKIIIFFGLIGASFFYGEIIITPAISILSSIEGLEDTNFYLKKWTKTIEIIVLTALFILQKYGIQIIGKLFSPIMLIWFFMITLLGIKGIILYPQVLKAFNPIWAVNFFFKYKQASFFSLGTVVLAITGAETLYADMGYFSKKSIRLAWFFIVMPALVINYFGQGALLLTNPNYIKNPFFLLSPSWAFLPIIIISTLATIIASQAAISSIFSLTKQAINLGYFPPIKMIHTSNDTSDQVYIPIINWILYFLIIYVIFIFDNSSNLTLVYGITVTGTMTITSFLICIVAIKKWNWNKNLVFLIFIVILFLDVSFFIANLTKIYSGAFLPLFLSLIMFTIMNTWRIERSNLSNIIKSYHGNSLKEMIKSLKKQSITRVSGTAIYMSRYTNIVPITLVQNFKHNKVLHEKIILLTIRTVELPFIPKIYRVSIEKLSINFFRIIANYGWRETPDIEEIFHRCNLEGFSVCMMEVSFFIFYESLFLKNKSPWYKQLRRKLFLILQKNSLRIQDQFNIIPDRVISLGIKIEI